LASHRSRHTIRAYRVDLTALFDYLDAGGVDALHAERRHIDAWRLQLTGQQSTIARKLAAVSSFYTYAMTDGATDHNPAARLRRPKIDVDHSSTQGMTQPQAQAFLDTARADSPRSRALACLMVFTGIRLDEALSGTTDDLKHDSGHRVLVVTRKGGKRQKIVLPAQVIDALTEYLGTAAAQGKAVVRDTGAAAPLFTTASGRRWEPSEAYRTVRRLAAAAGIPGVISPHSLRHTHATLALDAGVNLADLQDSMGQADPRTTRRYDRARGRLERASSHTVAGLLH
jgi:integrase/recombinase XerD